MNLTTKLISVFFFTGILLLVFLPDKKPAAAEPVAAKNHPLVTSEKCISCHEAQGKGWHGSHHQKSMELATEETVLGDFDNKSFVNPKDEITTRFFKKEGKFMVNTQGPDGKMKDFEIKYTFGVEPLQQYMIEFPGGRVQCLPVAWDTVDKKWYHLFPKLTIDHKEWLHWSRGGANWNTMCADCHSRELVKNYDPVKKIYSTTFKEINVSCQSCHGEGSDHVKNKSPMKDLTKLTSFQAIDRCARCHSRRMQISDHNKIEAPFMDNYVPELLGSDTYHGDGQIKGEVYVYGSFIQSKMYRSKLVRCSNCHDSHSNKIKFTGNNLCTQCHKIEDFDTPKHHKHQVGGKGASCIECHMPGKIYMGNDFRRDHSFRVPRPDLSVKFGTPNSCVACHDDKDNNWAAEAVNKWYGTKRKPHFSDLLLKTREQPMLAFAEAMKFVVKAEEPAIVRATILRDYAGMSSENEDILKAVIACLKDSDPLMRHTAASAIQEWPPQLRFTLAPPLCADRLRSVRVAAAALMVDMPEKAIDEKFKVPYEKAKKEYLASLKFNADFASGQMNIGNYHLKLREVDKAIEAYEESLTIDNRFNPARMNLARIYSGQGQNDKALKLLEKVVEQEPKFWGGWYSLGLLYNELKRLPDAEAALKKSAKLSNGHPNAYANWGLSLQGLERRAEAAEAFKAGLALAPGHPNLLDKLSIVYIQMKKWQEAEKAVLQLIRQFPQNQEFRGRLNWLQQQK